MNAGPVLIMAGGTGGHIFPGIAVARELQARGIAVLWLGSAGGLETRLVPQAGIEIRTLNIGGIRGKGLVTKLAAPLRILRALTAAWKMIGQTRPRSALALGGFAAGPGGIAAWLRGVPLVVHEQNSVPGMTNRILSTFAKMRLCGFRDALKDSRWLGNPVRADIAGVAEPAQRFASHDGAAHLLVLGGSQGAKALNERVPQALAMMPAQIRPRVRHQCGAKLIDGARAAYTQARITADVEPFIDDMAAAYAWADLVLCRAGALTLAELAAVGVAAVLVPFPFAVDDHQTRNAQAAVDAGAALLISETQADAERIAAVLSQLLPDRPRLLAMAQASRALAKPDAAARIADVCLEVAA